MPRDWSIENIEAASESTLGLNDFLDRVNILKVYDQIAIGVWGDAWQRGWLPTQMQNYKIGELNTCKSTGILRLWPW